MKFWCEMDFFSVVTCSEMHRNWQSSFLSRASTILVLQIFLKNDKSQWANLMLWCLGVRGYLQCNPIWLIWNPILTVGRRNYLESHALIKWGVPCPNQTMESHALILKLGGPSPEPQPNWIIFQEPWNVFWRSEYLLLLSKYFFEIIKLVAWGPLTGIVLAIWPQIA
jgi:hypothetical protein